jgi:hypothetical protein
VCVLVCLCVRVRVCARARVRVYVLSCWCICVNVCCACDVRVDNPSVHALALLLTGLLEEAFMSNSVSGLVDWAEANSLDDFLLNVPKADYLKAEHRDTLIVLSVRATVEGLELPPINKYKKHTKTYTYNHTPTPTHERTHTPIAHTFSDGENINIVWSTPWLLNLLNPEFHHKGTYVTPLMYDYTFKTNYACWPLGIAGVADGTPFSTQAQARTHSLTHSPPTYSRLLSFTSSKHPTTTHSTYLCAQFSTRPWRWPFSWQRKSVVSAQQTF